VTLLVGNKRNACAALYGLKLRSCVVRHVICVGSNTTADILRRTPDTLKVSYSRLESKPSEQSNTSDGSEDESEQSNPSDGSEDESEHKSEEEESEEEEPEEDDPENRELVENGTTYEKTGSCSFSSLSMQDSWTSEELDKFNADDAEELLKNIQEQLKMVCTAVSDLENRPSGSQDREAVLLHCDLGVNRSPTIAMLFLMLDGCSLRTAYQTLIRKRPGIDPVQPYREALRKFEISRRMIPTVQPTDDFAKHMSKLVQDRDLLSAMKVRRKAYKMLKQEGEFTNCGAQRERQNQVDIDAFARSGGFTHYQTES